MGKDSFYITTPIYYVNDKPHIGHSYTTILADVLSRYHRLLGVPTYFLTGTDEHGQKVQKAAIENKMTPQEQCDRTVLRFRQLWEKLEITNDFFVRTTDESHKQVVRKILSDLHAKDLIYKAEYKGRYCVPCERFFTEKDISEGALCPECGRPTDEIIESNYFFRMSRYQDWLVAYIESHPEFIQPDFRRNETLGFLKKPLEDLCISRPKTRLSWGIELPFDSDYVCYVWFDALINYISAAGYGSDTAKFAKWWPVNYHLIGKDILTTHTVYWPTMLKAMDVEMPKTIYAHGWWLTGSNKMSKSVGNVVNPLDMVEKYGVDAFRYFLMSEMSLGHDASFSEEIFVTRFNSDLANDLGNLLSRVVKMIFKQREGILPEAKEYADEDNELKEKILSSVASMKDSISGMKIDRGIGAVIESVRAVNKYFEKSAPWKLAAENNSARLDTVLYTAAEALRIISGILHPVMPGKMCELRRSLGIEEEACMKIRIEGLQQWGLLQAGTKLRDCSSLFQRIDVKDAKKEKSKAAPATVPAPENSEEQGLVSIDEFFKTKLIAAKITAAEKVEGADKLLKVEIDIGSEKRSIVSGIAQHYSPADIVGKTIVLVSNLKPAKIRGIESRGMLLAAKNGKDLKLVIVEGDIPPGSSVG